MALLPVADFLWPKIKPTFMKVRDADRAGGTYYGDRRAAGDLTTIWKLLLAVQFRCALRPHGRYATAESRIVNSLRIQTRLETAPADGTNSWRTGHLVQWNTALGVPGTQPPGPLFSSPPMVICTYRGTVVDNNSPFHFWIGATAPSIAEDPLGAFTSIKARAKNGAQLTGATNHTISVVGIGLVEPAE